MLDEKPDYTIGETCGYADYLREVLSDIQKIEAHMKQMKMLETLINADIAELMSEAPVLGQYLQKKLQEAKS